RALQTAPASAAEVRARKEQDTLVREGFAGRAKTAGGPNRGREPRARGDPAHHASSAMKWRWSPLRERSNGGKRAGVGLLGVDQRPAESLDKARGIVAFGQVGGRQLLGEGRRLA